MTVSTVDYSTRPPGNGVTTTFTVPFPWQRDADLVVSLVDDVTGADTPQANGSDYFLVGGDPDGTITMSVAPPVGKSLYVRRSIALLQDHNLTQNDGDDAEEMEKVLDRLVMMIQQVADGMGGGGGGGGGSGLPPQNIGAGLGLYAGATPTAYQFRSLVAGSNISLTPAADTITIDAAATGEVNTASNLGAGNGVFASKSGVDLRFKSLVAGANITLTPTGNDITITASSGVAGETNTASNLGSGSQLFKSKVGVDLQFRSLVQGANVTLTQNANDVTIAASGEANTISQSGASGVSLLQATPKVGVDLRTRGLIAGANVTVTPTGSTDVTIAATGEANTISSVAATGSSILPSPAKVGVDLKTKGLAATAPLQLASTATDLTYSLNLAANIDWTGRHKIEKNVGDVIDAGYNLAVHGLNGGAITDSGILLANLYRTVVDIKKTSVGGSDGPRGNSHGIYVQHRITGTAVSGDRLFGGIRSQVQNAAVGIPTEATAFYGAVNMTANNPNASWAYFCDVYHSSVNSGSDTRGYGAELLRTSAAGRCTAFEAIMMNAATQDGTAAFIARRQSGSAPGWTAAFAAGDSGGGVAVGVAFDAAHATVGTATLRAPAGSPLRLNGTATTADIRYNPTSTMFGGTDGAIEYVNGANATFAIRQSDSIPGFRGLTGTLVGAAGGASALPATPKGYMNAFVNHGGVQTAVKIPYYNF